MHQETLSITGCIRSEHRGDLGVIHQPEYQAGLWERPLSFSAQSEAERLLDSGWESFRFSGSVDELSEKLEATELSEFWKTEVKDQAEWFAELMGDLPIRLFFGKVEKDMCRRFHTDINTLRLLCTYIGPGTLWVSPEAIDHSQVAKGSNEEMVKDQQGIHQAGTGETTRESYAFPGRDR